MGAIYRIVRFDSLLCLHLLAILHFNLFHFLPYAELACRSSRKSTYFNWTAKSVSSVSSSHSSAHNGCALSPAVCFIYCDCDSASVQSILIKLLSHDKEIYLQ